MLQQGTYSWSYFWWLPTSGWRWAAHLAALVVFALLTVGLYSRLMAVLALVATLSYIGRARRRAVRPRPNQRDAGPVFVRGSLGRRIFARPMACPAPRRPGTSARAAGSAEHRRQYRDSPYAASHVRDLCLCRHIETHGSKLVEWRRHVAGDGQSRVPIGRHDRHGALAAANRADDACHHFLGSVLRGARSGRGRRAISCSPWPCRCTWASAFFWA